MCMHAWGGDTHATVSEGRGQIAGFPSFHNMGPKDGTQGVRLGGKYCC